MPGTTASGGIYNSGTRHTVSGAVEIAGIDAVGTINEISSKTIPGPGSQPRLVADNSK